jgi:TonB family protein
MSATDSIGYFIEFGENNLIIARTNLSQRPRTVDELREVWLGDAAAVDGLINELKPAGSTGKAVTLLRLKPRASFLADSSQAQKIKTASAVEDFLKEALGAENVPANWAWASSKDGKLPENGAQWVLDATPATATDEALAKIKGWSFELLRSESAPLSLAGALAAAARTAQAGVPVLFCDVAEARTHLYLITAQGISAHTTADAGFDSLAGSTQEALGLKFRGSAARLLFNETYDFADAAAKIVEPLAAGIKNSLPSLGAIAPASIVCGGILAKQAWITQSLATALGLKPFAPDTAALASSLGLSFGGNVKADTVSPSWLGVLGAAAAYDQKTPGATTPWHSALTGTPVAAPPFVPAIAPEPAPAPKPAVVITPPAKPAESAKPAAPVAKPAEPAAVKPAVVITPPAKPAEPAKPNTPVAASAKPSQPAVAAKPADPKAQAKQPEAKATPVIAKPTPAPAQKGPAKPEPAKPSPAPAPSTKPALAPVPAAARPATPAPFPKKKNNTPIIIGVAAAVVIGIVAFFMVSSGKKEKEQEAQRIELEKRAAEEAAARVKALEQAKANEERLKKEAEDARLKAIADAEAIRLQSEQNLKSTTERLLNARGGFTINTEPAGASISLGDRAPRTSPVTWNDLRLGRYDITISLNGYDSEQRSVEIKDSEVTDLGTIALKRQVGSVDVNSDPAGLTYEIKPAGSLFVNAADVRTGQTPAKVDNLPIGSYQVSISRANWPAYTSTVNVERNGTARVQGTFVGGSVTITSSPTGATVLRDNQSQVGVTPLTLNDLIPGTVTFTVTQRGMDPVPLTGKIESGKTLALNATLLDSDRVMKLTELDERPVQITIVEPELTSAQQADGGNVVVSLTVGKDGVPSDLKVEQASNPNLGRACLTAAAKWRFKPGTIKGKPVRSRVSIPFKFQPQS